MKKVSWLVGLVLALASSPAFAVPQTINFSGRLSTSAGPVNNSVSVTFRIFDAFTGGTQEWTETHASLTADMGLVYADLGSVTSFPGGMWDGSTKYLEIVINGEVLAPRMALNSVPYALAAERAESADAIGGIMEGDIVTTVTGSNGVSASKTGNTVALGLSTAGCANGQVYKYNGSTWACAADSDSAPTAGTGIAVSGNTVSLSTTGCAAGSVWKYNGTTFTCAADADTMYTAGAGINITGTTVALSTTGCANGEVWKFNGTTFTCEPDANTTYTAGTGINITGTTIALSTTGCAAGEVWKFDGANFSCEPDAVGPTYSAGPGIAFNGTAIGLSTTGCVTGEVWRFNGTTFACEPAYTDAQAISAVTGTTVSRTVHVGPTHFFNGRAEVGTGVSCSLPGTNCNFPASATTFQVPLQIPAPATLTQLSCLVLDNDANGTITVSLWNGSNNSAQVATQGAVSGSQSISTTTFSFPNITSSSRGPALEVSTTSNAGSMFIYQCFVSYTAPTIN